MKIIGCWLILVIGLISCGGKKVPDVSAMQVDLKLERFDNDLFRMDTGNIDNSLQQLHRKYPDFTQYFIFNVLALPPQPDSLAVVEQQVKYFLSSYKALKDSADILYKNMEDVQQDVKKGLQFVKYYFPGYKLPAKLITFVGPINSYANVITPDALGVGLQMYLGRNSSYYQSDAVQQLYPSYVARRFEKEYIAVNCMKSVIDDLFADNTAGRPLVEQMIQAGKRLYVLDQLMPLTEDTLKTGYTTSQLAGCYKNESAIWSYFVQNDLVFATDPSVMRDFMNDAPKTQVFGAESPGFIGQFVGWQIVKKWMEKNNKLSLEELMKANAKIIFEEARYKP